ncbi:CGNR zinc finger domain-containing protein [Sneathiella limimaris]|uniref:CGNR zinc finger domain-containing protein n=1 Tax=Sneathiella limimaris TaxID=1964213 RepID=UPI00146A88CE|nr:CGNR zinc finger domain-containing protein [Sneathiella limimaris]
MAKLRALVKAGVVNSEGFYSVGGRTAVDFANTIVRLERKEDGLASFEDLLTFLKAQELLHEDEASSYHMYLFQNPERCDQVMAQLREIRAKFRQALEQLSTGWPMDPMFVSEINDQLAGYKTQIRLEPAEEGYSLQTYLTDEGPEQLTYPILKDIAGFLASDQTDKIRQCAADDCQLYFINTSRNGRRRWCSMSTCGNRAKVNAYLKRQEA